MIRNECRYIFYSRDSQVSSLDFELLNISEHCRIDIQRDLSAGFMTFCFITLDGILDCGSPCYCRNINCIVWWPSVLSTRLMRNIVMSIWVAQSNSTWGLIWSCWFICRYSQLRPAVHMMMGTQIQHHFQASSWYDWSSHKHNSWFKHVFGLACEGLVHFTLPFSALCLQDLNMLHTPRNIHISWVSGHQYWQTKSII